MNRRPARRGALRARRFILFPTDHRLRVTMRPTVREFASFWLDSLLTDARSLDSITHTFWNLYPINSDILFSFFRFDNSSFSWLTHEVENNY